jgi:integrase
MPYVQLPDFMKDLQRREAIAARALEFIILTASRVSEVLGARWREFDMHSRLWVVPAHRMKSGREHRVPLSPQAVLLLRNIRSLRTADGEDALVFPGARPDRPLSGMSTAMLLRRMGRENLTTHGFRSSFRDWAAECTDYASEIAEAALAHQVGDAVERAYRRGDALEKRRGLMNDWAAYLGNCSKVTEQAA